MDDDHQPVLQRLRAELVRRQRQPRGRPPRRLHGRPPRWPQRWQRQPEPNYWALPQHQRNTEDHDQLVADNRALFGGLNHPIDDVPFQSDGGEPGDVFAHAALDVAGDVGVDQVHVPLDMDPLFDGNGAQDWGDPGPQQGHVNAGADIAADLDVGQLLQQADNILRVMEGCVDPNLLGADALEPFFFNLRDNAGVGQALNNAGEGEGEGGDDGGAHNGDDQGAGSDDEDDDGNDEGPRTTALRTLPPKPEYVHPPTPSDNDDLTAFIEQLALGDVDGAELLQFMAQEVDLARGLATFFQPALVVTRATAAVIKVALGRIHPMLEVKFKDQRRKVQNNWTQTCKRRFENALDHWQRLKTRALRNEIDAANYTLQALTALQRRVTPAEGPLFEGY
ncbi:hypothetical protein PTSG_06845 [Salpingoeca rosetta]|uniref:Uncharacterized protein n=1 Tax=Salpingoeca rosetta (strain ATCC 50818 / BSB-021) TaxID=946362 RepID=F2UEZ2_SALR5|nr:uncharacterized protein PTSG_06845 [Salpingoeca rosetta]EGD75192.1 hypothetical protein PTSG_06845 [Salpingoeca rosetta]|eukprot:XP_004992245.1 hypothetical protein PTSG_06845 [Salpingoeca rosetta]